MFTGSEPGLGLLLIRPPALGGGEAQQVSRIFTLARAPGREVVPSASSRGGVRSMKSLSCFISGSATLAEAFNFSVPLSAPLP